MTLLQEKLDTRKEAVLKNIPADIQEKMFKDSQTLKESNKILDAPQVGETLRDFNLLNPFGEKVSLDSLVKNGPVVITFYRGGWCPYCNLELHEYQLYLPQIKALGATLVAITPELPDSSLTTKEKNNLEFEVLTDRYSSYIQEIGLSFSLSDEILGIYSDFGIEIEGYNGEDQTDLPFAATFIVDQNKTVTYAFVDSDYTVRAEPSEVVRELKALVE